MHAGARTPEELDTLLEDAFVLGDEGVVAAIFEPGALLSLDADEVRGQEIARAIMGASGRFAYLADSPRVHRAGDTALIVADGSVSVARRGPTAGWRFVIALLKQATPTRGADQ